MTPAETKAQLDDLARRLAENTDVLRKMCAAIERLQKELVRETKTQMESWSEQQKIPQQIRTS